MDWLNLPIAEIAFALGGVIGIVGGFWAGYSVENFASYQKGYKNGRENERTDAEIGAEVDQMYKMVSYTYDAGENAIEIVAERNVDQKEEISITIKNPTVQTIMDIMHTYDGRYRANQFYDITLEGHVHD